LIALQSNVLSPFSAYETNLAFDRLTSIGRHSARERVAHLLLELFIGYRTQWPGSQIKEMHLPLTQEHIDDATGLTFVPVNRVLRDLRKDGIVDFHYRRLQILAPAKLSDVAGLGPQLVMFWIRQRMTVLDSACIFAEPPVVCNANKVSSGSVKL